MSESYTHSDIKTDLYWGIFQEDESAYIEMEKSVGNTRTDVIAEIGDHTLAIEIQHTPIPIKSILRRMKEHTKNNAHTLWLITQEAILEKGRVKNLNWVLFIQKLQGGMIFLPAQDKIIPARIDSSYTWKGEKLVMSKKTWLEERKPIELDQLQFEYNDYFGVNTVTVNEWWVERDYLA